MRMPSKSVIAVLIIAAVIFAGEAYAYLPSDRGFSSDVSVDGSEITYSIGAAGAYVGSSTLIDNGDMKPVNELYIYHDTSYSSEVDENRITATGSQVFTQSYYIDQLTKNLNFRGMKNITTMDSDELKEKLESDLSSTTSGKGLIIISGAVPDNIFGDSMILEDWIDAGGSLYWAGNEIGKYKSTTDGCVEVNRQSALIGTDSFTYTSTSAHKDTDYRSVFCYENQELSYSPDVTTITGRGILATGFTDDGSHHSVTFIQKGNGQICICASDFSSKQIHDMAISIASGLCYKSQIIDSQEKEFNRNTSGTLMIPTVHGNLSVYISVGKYHCAYAERFDL